MEIFGHLLNKFLAWYVLGVEVLTMDNHELLSGAKLLSAFPASWKVLGVTVPEVDPPKNNKTKKPKKYIKKLLRRYLGSNFKLARWTCMIR